MSDTIDPITLLRQTITSGKKELIVYHQETRELEFQKFEGSHSSVKIPIDWPTAWSKKDGSGFYTLGQLWLWVINSNVSQGEYVKNARAKEIQIIPFAERDIISRFFDGEKSSSNVEEIDDRVRPDTLLKRSHLKTGRVHL